MTIYMRAVFFLAFLVFTVAVHGIYCIFLYFLPFFNFDLDIVYNVILCAPGSGSLKR